LPAPEMRQFIEANDFKGRKVAFFGTYWMKGMGANVEADATTGALEKKGATVLGSYRCPGKTMLFNLGRPNNKDIDGAKKFAREMVKPGV
jgi:flavodoxin